MKKFFTTVLLIVITGLSSYSQDTTKILFIGNSFTYFNDMPSMFDGLAKKANFEIAGVQYTPPGYDLMSQGLTDPQLFANIKRDVWDYVVIQDNQGRLVLDSGNFNPGVLAAYKAIYDSIKANNQCSRIVWFAGWGWEGGLPQYFPGDNSIKMIGRILYNSLLVNKTYKEIVSPIGEAWIAGLTEKPWLPLWGADGAHPSPVGSYLTACVLFSTIFKTDPTKIPYNSTLHADSALYLRWLANNIVFDSTNFTKYNLKPFTPAISYDGNRIVCQPGYSNYKWFREGTKVKDNNENFLKLDTIGLYYVKAMDQNGCWHRSVSLPVDYVGVGYDAPISTESYVYPNPAGDYITIRLNSLTSRFSYEISDPMGKIITSSTTACGTNTGDCTIDISRLRDGIYFILINTSKGIIINKLVKY